MSVLCGTPEHLSSPSRARGCIGRVRTRPGHQLLGNSDSTISAEMLRASRITIDTDTSPKNPSEKETRLGRGLLDIQYLVSALLSAYVQGALHLAK